MTALEKLDSLECSIQLKNKYNEGKGVSWNLKNSSQRVGFWSF